MANESRALKGTGQDIDHRESPTSGSTHHIVLACGDDAAAVARQWAGRRVSKQSVRALDWDAVEVVISELVTNAIQHAQTDVDLKVNVTGTGVRIEVRDHGCWVPAGPQADPQDRVGGWGLVLVAELSDGWGRRSDGSGTVVWARFDITAVTS